MPLRQSDAIEVKRIPGKGRGVFARREISEGEVIERVPVLVLPSELVEDHSVRAGLWEYSFEWGAETVALALGYGSLYNHSYRPNARCDVEGDRTKVFSALRTIASGEEITINYNGEPDDRSPVWFEVVDDQVATVGRGPAKSRRRRTP